MAELSGVAYISSGAFLNRMDARAKLLCVAGFSLAGLNAGPAGLCILSILLAVCFRSIRFPLTSVRTEGRYLMVLLAVVFLARALFTPGQRLSAAQWLPVTREGLLDGAVVCWRFTLVIAAGGLMVVTSRSKEIKAAVQAFLAPIPLVPEKRVATMMGLTLRLIPVVLDQARKTADAQRARGVENRKNPIVRIITLAVPLIRKSFETADHMAVAMDARCYSEHRTDPVLSASRSDWAATVVTAGLCLAAAMA